MVLKAACHYSILNFRFGPEGLKLRPAEPLPVIETEAVSEEEDDDEDDFFGLGSDDDDDDEDDERPVANSVSDVSGVDDAQESDDDDDEDDLLGISALLDIFTGDDDTPSRPLGTTSAPLLQFTIPILPRPTTSTPLEDHELPVLNNEQETNYEDVHDNTQEPLKVEEVEENTGLTESNTEDNTDEDKEQITESSNKVVYTAKPDKAPSTNKVKKGVIGDKKKPTVTSTSVNAIHDPEKPAKKPINDESNEDDDDDILDDDDDDIDDEDDEFLDDDEDDDKDDEDEEDEEDEDKPDDEKNEDHDDDEDEKAEELAVLDDDDDEEEDAMLTALMDTGKSKKTKEGIKTNQTNVHKHDDDDYGLGGFLARERHSSESRQSKITRL